MFTENTHSGTPETPCKKPNYPKPTMLEKPQVGSMVNSAS